jgi:hypothetical protein
MPYWCVLQAVGHEGVIEKIKNTSDMVRFLEFFFKVGFLFQLRAVFFNLTRLII